MERCDLCMGKRTIIFRKENKYFKTMLLWITIVTVITVIVYSSVLYINIEKIVLREHYRMNQVSLAQVKYNVQYMNEMIRNLCLSIYFDKDVKYLISKNEEDLYNVSMIISRLKNSLLFTYPFIDSVYFYNNNLKCIYSTQKTISYDMSNINDLLNKYVEIPKLIPIPNEAKKVSPMNGEEISDDVFSYFLYQSKDENNFPDGAIIVNVNEEWLLNNIQIMNSLSDQNKIKSENIFVLDQNNEFIGSKSYDSNIMNDIRLIYKYDNIVNNNIEYINNNKYIVTYLELDNIEWTLIKIQPLDEAFTYIQNMRTNILLITILFITLSIIVSNRVSKVIYKPIGSFVNQIRSRHTTDSALNFDRGEIQFLQEVYRTSDEQLSKYKQEKASNVDIMRVYYLQKLIMGFYTEKQEEFQRVSKDIKFMLCTLEPLVICMLRIDNYMEFEHKYSQEEKELFKFAVINIMMEVISENYKNETVDMKNDQIIVIMNINKTDEYKKELGIILRKAQDYVLQYIKLSVSITIGDMFYNIKEINKNYNKIKYLSDYKLIFGKKSIIDFDMAQHNVNDTSVTYSEETGKKLIEAIKSGNLKRSDEALLEIVDQLSKMNIFNIYPAIFKLTNSIKVTVDQMNCMNIETIIINFGIKNELINNTETLDEIYKIIKELIKEITSNQCKSIDEKHKIMVNTIINIIQADYSNQELCLTQIAGMLNMSPVYVGRIIKERIKVSISNYINDVRLEKALVLLKGTNLNINQIAEKVGIVNNNYFYKLFKKKYGVTPKEYLFRNNCDKFMD